MKIHLDSARPSDVSDVDPQGCPEHSSSDRGATVWPTVMFAPMYGDCPVPRPRRAMRSASVVAGDGLAREVA